EAEDCLYSLKTALNDSRAATVSTFGILQSDSAWNHPVSIWRMVTRDSCSLLQTQLIGERAILYNCFGRRSVACGAPCVLRCFFAVFSAKPAEQPDAGPRRSARPSSIPTGPGAR